MPPLRSTLFCEELSWCPSEAGGRWVRASSLLLAASAARPADDGQTLLDKATDIKLSAENVNDLNEVVKLTRDAIKTGLDEGNTKFANGLLASTLTQRGELICFELFERPVTPGRAQAGRNGAGRPGRDGQDRLRTGGSPNAARPAATRHWAKPKRPSRRSITRFDCPMTTP